MKTIFMVEFILKTMHFLQDVTLSSPDGPIVRSRGLQSRAEKCESEGERALEKFRFNLERKDWTLEKHYGEEGITIKSTYDFETQTYFLFIQAALDLECNRVARDMRDNTLEATADWHSDVKEYKVLQRLTDACWVVYQVMDPSPVGVIASRDVVILSYSRKIGDTHFVTMNSILWSGVEPREEMVRAEMKEGSGMSFSPDPERNTTRTLLRWVFSLDYKVPIIPATILLKFHAEGCRQYILGLRKYLSAKHQLPLVVLQD